MLRGFTKAILTTALLALASSRVPVALAGAPAEELCSLPSGTLLAAAQQHKDCAFAIEEVTKHSVATWITDRSDSTDKTLQDIVKTCPESSRMTIVVYGLPDKDCAGGFSTGGSNKNAEDYKKWIQKLADAVGQRKALFVLEPDAVGLLINGGCGVGKGYGPNVKAAIEILSKNPNADIYLDLGYWKLGNEADASAVAKVVKDLSQGGRLKGVALNTSNYRSNQEISRLCGNFQKAYGDDKMHCIVDTSRNFNEPASSEWCNAKFGAIGAPPTANTGFPNLDYFIWIKPAGESDGTCDKDVTADAMKGPAAGQFFKENFVNLWNNGYFVKQQQFPKIDGTIRDPIQKPTPAPTKGQDQPTQAPAPTKPSPTVTEPVPTPTKSDSPPPKPVVTTLSPAPTNQTPPKPTSETPSGESDKPTSTPAPETTKPKKKKKDCPSYIEDEPTPAPSSPKATPAPSKPKDTLVKTPSEPTPTNSTVPTPAPTKKKSDENVDQKALSFSTEDKSVQDAAASVKATNESAAEGANSPGAMAALVVGAVGLVAVAAVLIVRRRKLDRRNRSHTLRTPVDNFGQLRATPADVTVI